MQCYNIVLFLIIGSIITIQDCQCRAVNINNTWTLPQDGFSMFYRFFRDKISWFEADAVCQFHHANLVTVDNGLQFDTARAFLKELDVTENVWIGLMRPQSLDHFIWTNSKSLNIASGFWADPLPALNTPLCAVIDPVRDFRWHAIRCGGPETAAFLCEMTVPEWASECIIRALPSLTIQYMSDSATVELFRDCGEEGIKHMTCRGKEDHEAIQSEMICMSEHKNMHTDNLLIPTTLSESHQKSIDLIKIIESDNNEDNGIESQINKIDVAVAPEKERDLNEMMMGDQPYVAYTSTIIDEIKPTKSSKKITKEKSLKKYAKQSQADKYDSESMKEEMMMGDQPADDLPQISNEEFLPRQKKTLSSDHNQKEDILKETAQSLLERSVTDLNFHSTSTDQMYTYLSESRARRETILPTSLITNQYEPKTNTSTESTIAKTEKSFASLNKNENDYKAILADGKTEANATTLATDHFIPPMLLVRTNFTSTKSHLDFVLISSSTTIAKDIAATESTVNLSDQDKSNDKNLLISMPTVLSSSEVTKEIPKKTTFESTTTTQLPFTTTANTLTSTSTVADLSAIHHKSNMMRPHAPKHAGEILYHSPIIHPINPTLVVTKATPLPTDNIKVTSERENEANGLQQTTTKYIFNEKIFTSENTSEKSPTEDSLIVHPKRSSNSKSTIAHPNNNKHHKSGKGDESVSHEEHADFSNSENFYRYKPNRRRILTKPVTHTYIQKIFG